MDIETRLSNLEKLVFSFIENQNKFDEYKEYDIAGCRNTEESQANDIQQNADDISDNREGLTETFENTLVNTDDITVCREAIEELYEMLIESEE